MSDEQFVSNDDIDDVDFEEISSEEVDRVVSSLEQLLETVESENIKVQLEEAISHVYYLVYDDEEEELNEAA